MHVPQNLLQRYGRHLIWAALLGSFLLGSVLLALPDAVQAEPKGPQAVDRQVTRMVTTLLTREHVLRKELDNEIARRGLGNYLKALDPMRVYFLQSDVDEFNQKRDEIDDQIREGNIALAYTIFNRFLQRVEERVKLIDELLKMEHDFSVTEECVTSPEAATYATTELEIRDKWRKRIKLDLLILKGDKTEGQAAIDKLTRRYHSFAKRMSQFTSDEILEMYLTSITTGYDPHTTYMSPSSLENFYIQMKLNLEGIGAALQLVDGYTVVSKIIPGGAAEKQGKLKAEDRIVSVGQGENGEMVDVVDMTLNDVVKLIRGKAGTVVRLGVIPKGSTETVIYNITRQRVELKDSEARGVIFEAGTNPKGNPYKIGVIDLPSFYMDMAGARQGVANFKSTTRDVKKILEDFTAKGVDAVVIDLRDNGGGALTEAINLTGLFIDVGPVVQVRDADGKSTHYDDPDRGVAWGGPLVIVTNKHSASASEILAGAIQDYNRGLIVGDDTTHGKGTVQSLLDLGGQLFRVPDPPNLGALKVTMQQFYRPNGESTQKRGVLADVTLPSISNHTNMTEADLDYAIEFDKIPAVAFTRLALVNRDLVAGLRTASSERVAKSAEFQKLEANIKRYREQKQRTSVSVNEKTFMAERAEFDAEKEDEKHFDESQKQTDEVVKRDFYFNEVLAITCDYLEALRKQKLAASPDVKPAG